MTAVERERLALAARPGCLGRVFMGVDDPWFVTARKDLAEGRVEVIEFCAEGYAVGEDEDDNGPYWFFELGDGTVLFLHGQGVLSMSEDACPEGWVEAVDAERAASAGPEGLPKCWRVERALHSGAVFELKWWGPEMISPGRTVARGAIALWGHDSYRFSGRVETLEGDIARAVELWAGR